MPINPKVTIKIIGVFMAIKLGSVVMIMMFFFIAKISFETAMGDKNSALVVNDRSPASIDQSYNDHMNSRH